MKVLNLNDLHCSNLYANLTEDPSEKSDQMIKTHNRMLAQNNCELILISTGPNAAIK